jgi:transposase
MDTGARDCAQLLRMGPNTERSYRRALSAAGLLDGDPEALPPLDVLKAAVEQQLPKSTPEHKQSSAQPWLDDIQKLVDKGNGPQAIWDTLRLKHDGFKVSLWAVRRLCRRLKKARPVAATDVAIGIETEPGLEAQVDFGYVGRLYDPEQGVLRKAWVFIMTLAHSRHMFCRTVFDQRVETWVALHIAAFDFFGGVPRVIVPDNLKAAVIRAAFGLGDNPALNRSYRELARHYGFKIDPTPPRDPQKKGKVESGVKYTKRNFFAPREPADIHEANTELERWVFEIAGQRIHGTTGQRPLAAFALEEQVALLPLPMRPYETVQWKQAKVHQDGQICFERRLYPVPWRLIGKSVWVRATPTTVAVYFAEQRVATHERNRPVPQAVRDNFLPPERAPLRYRSREHWEKRADRLGEEVGRFVREVFDSDDVLSLLRQVQAIVGCLEKYPAARREAACRRASFYGNYSYVGVRDILRKGLDLQPLPLAALPPSGILESPRFARTARELLQLPLEVTDESN